MNRFKLSALALAAGVAATSMAHAGTIVAPYFFGWSFNSTDYKFKNLTEAKSRAGMDGMTIAFAISNNGACSLSGGMDATMNNASVKADVKAYINGGGRVILSFGGASGTYLESVCSTANLVTLIRQLIDTHGTRSIDWDIEGGQLGDTRLNGVRNAAIKQLQAIYPDLYTSFTLPVDPFRTSSEPGGLPPKALELIKGAASAGVTVSMVNIMAMDYGTYYSGGKKMGDLAVSAAQSTFNQLKGVYPSKTDAQLWAMIGITPMIGQNDEASEIFTPADATVVANFAKQKGIGLLSYWAAQRDRVGSGSKDDFSRANTRDYEYYQIFATAKDSTPPAPAPAPAPAPTAKQYTVKSSFSNLCLDIAGASTADGAKVVQQNCSGAASQVFSFVPDTSGTYRIVNMNSGRSLDVTDVSTANGALIQQWANSSGANQRFAMLTDTATGTVRLQAAHSARCVDVKDWNSAPGAGIQQWDCSVNANQKWALIPVSSAPAPAPAPAPTPAPAPAPTPAPAPAPTPAPAPAPAPAPSSCAAWTEGITYNVGQVVSYQGKQYKALVTHTAFAGANWNPAATPTLWTPTSASCGPTPAPAPAPAPSPAPAPAPSPAPAPAPAPAPNGTLTLPEALKAVQTKRVYVGYYPTWSDNWFDATGKTANDVYKASKFAKVPATYTHVMVSFADPNFSWAGINTNSFSGTGITFSASPKDIKAAIDVLHQRNQKVILAVGGATYNNWGPLAAQGAAGSGSIINALAKIQTEMGFDGLDVDYEADGDVDRYANAIKALRKAVDLAGGGRVLTLAGWSSGADCTSGTTADPACAGKMSYWGGNAGRERGVVLKYPAVANMLDLVNVMSYDARFEHYDGITAYNQYRSLFPSKTIVSIGLEPSPEGWAGGMLVVNDADAQCTGSRNLQDQYGANLNQPYSVQRYASAVANGTASNRNARDGAMLWAIIKTGGGSCGSAPLATPGTVGQKVGATFGLTIDPLLQTSDWK